MSIFVPERIGVPGNSNISKVIILSLVNIFWISSGSDKENYFPRYVWIEREIFSAQQAWAMVNLKPNFLGRIISGHSSGVLDEYL